MLSAPWQRCTVYFLRDALGHCAKDLLQLVGGAIRPILRAANLEEARRLLEETVAHLESGSPRSPGCCWRPRRPAGLGRLSCGFPAAHHSKLLQAAQHQPAGLGQPRDRPAHRRGGRAPSDAALLRLVGSLLIEQNDEWLVSRLYLSEASMAELTQPTSTTGKELQAA